MIIRELSQFGWTDAFKERWVNLAASGLQPARVVADFGTSLRIVTPKVYTAELSGKLAHHANREDVPKVGDWVAVRISEGGNPVVEAVVPRRSEIARKVAGQRTVKQVIAANVDIAFVLLALDNDFSIERLKRFLYQLSINAIEPVIVLNKADKTRDVQGYIDRLRSLELPIVVATATQGTGVAEILELIVPGQTAILLGSSGVGKSTLTNKLLGREAQETGVVRESDAAGKHTTVHRELFTLPNGGLLIDTPGIRELQLWGTEEELDDNFDDVALLIGQCKYSTCRHGTEPECAIRDALQGGVLQSAHYASYVKMKKELTALKVKNTARLALGNKRSRKQPERYDDEY